MRLINILHWNLHWKVHLLEEASVSLRIQLVLDSWDDGMMSKEVKQIKEFNFFKSRKLLKEV